MKIVGTFVELYGNTMRYYYYKTKSSRSILVGDDKDRWAFFLCVNKFPNLVAWKEMFKIPGSIIKDELRKVISPDEMEMIITMKNNPYQNIDNLLISFHHRSFKGTHNLAHIIVGETVFTYTCIGNEDCWDLCTYR